MFSVNQLLVADWCIYVSINLAILAQIMACRLFSVEPISEQVTTYSQMGPCEHISMTFESNSINFHPIKCISKCRLLNGEHFSMDYPMDILFAVWHIFDIPIVTNRYSRCYLVLLFVTKVHESYTVYTYIICHISCAIHDIHHYHIFKNFLLIFGYYFILLNCILQKHDSSK